MATSIMFNEGGAQPGGWILDEPPAFFRGDQVRRQDRPDAKGVVFGSRRIEGGAGPRWEYLVHFERNFDGRQVDGDHVRISHELSEKKTLVRGAIGLYREFLVLIEVVNLYPDGTRDFIVRQLNRVEGHRLVLVHRP